MLAPGRDVMEIFPFLGEKEGAEFQCFTQRNGKVRAYGGMAGMVHKNGNNGHVRNKSNIFLS